MAIYCMCLSVVLETKPIGDLPDAPVKAVLPLHPMRCISTGMNQYIEDGRFGPRRHFPNADLFECSACGCRVAKDA